MEIEDNTKPNLDLVQIDNVKSVIAEVSKLNTVSRSQVVSLESSIPNIRDYGIIPEEYTTIPTAVNSGSLLEKLNEIIKDIDCDKEYDSEVDLEKYISNVDETLYLLNNTKEFLEDTILKNGMNNDVYDKITDDSYSLANYSKVYNFSWCGLKSIKDISVYDLLKQFKTIIEDLKDANVVCDSSYINYIVNCVNDELPEFAASTDLIDILSSEIKSECIDEYSSLKRLSLNKTDNVTAFKYVTSIVDKTLYNNLVELIKHIESHKDVIFRSLNRDMLSSDFREYNRSWMYTDSIKELDLILPVVTNVVSNYSIKLLCQILQNKEK